MYLRFDSRLDFPALARALCEDLSDDALDWDYENVYEWMYLELPQFDFSLNLSREHGWADVDDESLDQYQHNAEVLEQIVQPGPVYVFGWNRRESGYVDQFPDSLPSFIADRLSVDVAVYNRRINVDIPDGEPIRIVSPKHQSSS